MVAHDENVDKRDESFTYDLIDLDGSVIDGTVLGDVIDGSHHATACSGTGLAMLEDEDTTRGVLAPT